MELVLLSVRETASELETIIMIVIVLFVIQIGSVKGATTSEFLTGLFLQWWSITRVPSKYMSEYLL